MNDLRSLLQFGNIVQTANQDYYIVTDSTIVNTEGHIPLSTYNRKLQCGTDLYRHTNFDIIRIYKHIYLEDNLKYLQKILATESSRITQGNAKAYFHININFIKFHSPEFTLIYPDNESLPNIF